MLDLGERRPRALVLYGGWPDHYPEEFAHWSAENLLQDFEITLSQEMECLNRETLGEHDLLLPIWTFGDLTQDQEESLLEAVADGLGVLAWHGATSSFLESRRHKWLLGGQFVGHPGGAEVTYRVEFLHNDPLTHGIEGFEVTTEQYYFLLDPSVKILAETYMVSNEIPWIRGLPSAVAWKRHWGEGQVFYSSLGHSLDTVQQPSMLELLTRAAKACSRTPAPLPIG